jgi:hypothetical protein
MPLEDWIQHCKVAQFFYDWQTIIAGALALLAAWLTVRATKRATDREIEASQAQIETTVRLERERVSSESETLRWSLAVELRQQITRAMGAYARPLWTGLHAERANHRKHGGKQIADGGTDHLSRERWKDRTPWTRGDARGDRLRSA